MSDKQLSRSGSFSSVGSHKSSASKKDGKQNANFKTQICPNYKTTCLDPSQCKFAHGRAELQRPASVLTRDWRTAYCSHFDEAKGCMRPGGCPRGEECRFAHAKNELRDLRKTELCDNPNCPYKKNTAQCNFAHGREELRPGDWPLQSWRTEFCQYYRAKEDRAPECPFGARCKKAHSAKEKKEAGPRKTRVCEEFLAGTCRHMHNSALCNFAHGRGELQCPPTIPADRWRRDLCPTLLNPALGQCKFGINCQHAHSQMELHDALGLPSPRTSASAAAGGASGSKTAASAPWAPSAASSSAGSSPRRAPPTAVDFPSLPGAPPPKQQPLAPGTQAGVSSFAASSGAPPAPAFASPLGGFGLRQVSPDLPPGLDHHSLRESSTQTVLEGRPGPDRPHFFSPDPQGILEDPEPHTATTHASPPFMPPTDASLAALRQQGHGGAAPAVRGCSTGTVVTSKCAICWERPADHVMVTCGHFGYCAPCVDFQVKQHAHNTAQAAANPSPAAAAKKTKVCSGGCEESEELQRLRKLVGSQRTMLCPHCTRESLVKRVFHV